MFLVCAGLWIGASQIAFAGERLVDLAPPRTDNIELRWADVGALRNDSDPVFHRMSARIHKVPFHLDVSRYVGKTARIEFVIPMASGLLSPAAMRVRWRATDPFSDGQALAGQRRMVYFGIIDTPVIETAIDMELQVDSRLFTGRLKFEPFFEISLQQ